MTYLQIRGRGEVEKACTYTLSSNVCNFNNQKSEIKHKTNQISVFSDAIKSKNNKNGWYFFLTHPVKRIFIFHTLLIANLVEINMTQNKVDKNSPRRPKTLYHFTLYYFQAGCYDGWKCKSGSKFLLFCYTSKN